MITEESYSIIDKLIQQGRCFAFWRIPGEETIHFRMQTTGSPDLIYDLSALNGRSGFVIAPFHVSEKHPIVLIQPDCLEVSEDIVEYPPNVSTAMMPTLPEVRPDTDRIMQ